MLRSQGHGSFRRYLLPILLISLLFLSGLLFLAPAASAALIPAFYQQQGGDKSLFVNAEAGSETGDPLLSLNANESATTQYKANTDLTSGLPQHQKSLTTGEVQLLATFEMKAALPQTYYLNLSKLVVGTLWWSSTVAGAAQEEVSKVRIEVRQGATRVGGYEWVYGANDVTTSWVPLNFKFRPEVSKLDQGEKLTLLVSRSNGLADFFIGTAGSQQSFIEFRYFDKDPLQGLAYLAGRNLLVLPDEQPSEGPGSPRVLTEAAPAEPSLEEEPSAAEPATTAAPPLTGLAVVPGLLLLALRRRPSARTVAPLLVILLLASALSGCLLKKNPDLTPSETSTKLEPTVDFQFLERLDLAKLKIGAMLVSLRDNDVGLPIAGAHASLLGTTQHTMSNKTGRFAFNNLTQSEYMLRIEATDFEVLEKEIPVKTGYATLVNITLVPSNPNAGHAHKHDLWGLDLKRELQTVDFQPRGYSYTSSIPGQWYCPSIYASGTSLCETQVPINFDTPILAGTGRVEVKLKWDNNEGPKEYGLRFTTSVYNPYPYDQFMLPRGPEDPFNIAIFPHEADPGHQTYTDWAFYVRAPHSTLYNPGAAPLLGKGGKVQFTLTVYKGVVPLEPKHRDVWNGASEIILFNGMQKTAGPAYTADTPNSGYSFLASQTPKAFVPPGTKEIRGTLSWEGNPMNTVWGLSYKGGNVPAGKFQVTKVTMDSAQGNKATFVLLVKSEEVDPIYKMTSSWYFYPDDNQAPLVDGTTYSKSALGGVTWTLTAKAIKDPNYVFVGE